MTGALVGRAAPERVLESLYKRHAGDVYRYSLAVLGSAADAEDVTQATFINAYRAIERGERPRQARNWLRSIAHNLCRQHFRQAARRLRADALTEDVGELVSDEQAPALDDVVRALKRLPYNQRAALVMREFEGRPVKEIAADLELSESAVETLLFRARRALREQLEGSLSCLEAERAISRQLDGALPRAERGALRAHLRECEECATLARRVRAQRGAMKSLALVPLPAALAAAPLGGGATATPVAGGAAFAGSLVAKVIAAALATAVLAGLGYEGVRHHLLPFTHAPSSRAQAKMHGTPQTPASGHASAAAIAAHGASRSAPVHGRSPVVIRSAVVHHRAAPHPRSASTPSVTFAPVPRPKHATAPGHQHPVTTVSVPRARQHARGKAHVKPLAPKHTPPAKPTHQKPTKVKPSTVNSKPGAPKAQRPVHSH